MRHGNMEDALHLPSHPFLYKKKRITIKWDFVPISYSSIESSSSSLNLGTSNYFPLKSHSRRGREFIQSVLRVIKKHEHRGFVVRTLEGDNEFDVGALHEDICHRNLVICDRDEHSGPAERSVCTFKEHFRCFYRLFP